MSRLHEEYLKNIKPNLMKELGLKNIYSVPELKKIVINMGLGIDANDKKKLEAAVEDLKKISGQMPIVTKTKKAIANFKTKENMPIGCKVTLRKKRMYEFIDRLINIALPRTKDFSGLSSKNFDGFGNYTYEKFTKVLNPSTILEFDDKKLRKTKYLIQNLKLLELEMCQF